LLFVDKRRNYINTKKYLSTMNKGISILSLLIIVFLVGCTYGADSVDTTADSPSLGDYDVDLENCKSYFDGCNNCYVIDGIIQGCTEMACEYVDDEGNSIEEPEGKCIEYY
jgi:hypothetical protein